MSSRQARNCRWVSSRSSMACGAFPLNHTPGRWNKFLKSHTLGRWRTSLRVTPCDSHAMPVSHSLSHLCVTPLWHVTPCDTHAMPVAHSLKVQMVSWKCEWRPQRWHITHEGVARSFNAAHQAAQLALDEALPLWTILIPGLMPFIPQ